MSKPIIVYTHKPGGPNPFKVLIILEELGVTYETIPVQDPKEEWFKAINPNGRVPTIVDRNTGVTLWESGAILEYLVDTYDKEGKLTVADPKEKWQLKQYLHFQMSGQGPYYGQAVWFHVQPEDNPIAKERYNEQISRVIGVLDNLLEGKQYLVGNKCTYVDLSFLPWHMALSYFPFFKEALWEKYEIEKKFPNYMAWNQRMMSRASVKKAYGF